jgi:hypothetical protein
LCKGDHSGEFWETVGDVADWLYQGIHTGLDIAGIFDPTPICDTLNAAGYAGEALSGQGGWVNAGFSAMAIVPYMGDIGKAGKYAGKSKIVRKGIYEFVDKTGMKYIGQSGNIPNRIATHLSSGKLLSENLSTLKITEVRGGKTAREIVEQLRINELGGIDNLANERNPIGKSREYLLEELK